MSVSEITPFGTSSQLLDQRTASAGVGVFFEAGLSLRTQEGDRVDLNFGNERRYSSSQTQSTAEEGPTVQEFSSVAVAASRFSQVVQGDLNDDELAAIRKLISDIEPLVQGFFAQNVDDFNLDQAVTTLTNNLGVLEEIGLELEKTVVKSLALESFTQGTAADPEVPDAAPAGSEDPQFDVANIRQLPELVLASVKAEFEKHFQALNDVSNELILKSLTDLMDFFREQIGQVLEPLRHANAQSPDESQPPVETEPVADPAQE